MWRLKRKGESETEKQSEVTGKTTTGMSCLTFCLFWMMSLKLQPFGGKFFHLLKEKT